jgi:PAS domain S-box-containing protein
LLALVTTAGQVHGQVGAEGDVLERRSVQLPPAPASAGQARRLVREVLGDADREELRDAAELAVSEIATNAALHGHTPFDVTATLRPGGLRVEVRDSNPMLPAQRDYDRHATTGRGMALVGAITSRCGVTGLGAQGKVVWFELDDAAADDADALPDVWDGPLSTVWDVSALEPDPGPPAPPAGSPDDEVTVVLRGIPPTLWLAGRQHHDALLRELVLHLSEHDDVEVDLAAADRSRGTVSSALLAALEQARQAGAARPAVPQGHPSPLPPVPERLDLELRLSRETGAGFGALQDALDAAERLAMAGRLLSRPGLPEVVAVRDWVCEQVQSQLGGVPPSPWPGTAQERFETDVNDQREAPGWDLDEALASGRGVVAADDANRIIGVSERLAAALGWSVDGLVGRRVVTLIPPALREAHVAGFTRHLTTGEAHVLGVPLRLPVLHADGREVPCDFLVEQLPPRGGRSAYLAWIQPVEPEEG